MRETDIDDHALAPRDVGESETPATGGNLCPDCQGSGLTRSGFVCPTCRGAGEMRQGLGGG